MRRTWKLTASQKEEICKRYFLGRETQTRLAAEFGVTQAGISAIVGRWHQFVQPARTTAHWGCNHPRTREARAKCRTARRREDATAP